MTENINGVQVCPIWRTFAETKDHPEKQGVTVVDSPRAGGKYSISTKAQEALEELDDKTKTRLTSHLVKQRSLGVECPRIEEKTIRNKEYGEALSYSERADRLLELIGRKAGQTSGKPVEVISWWGSPQDANSHPYYEEALAASESTEREELIGLLNEMQERKWLKDTLNNRKPRQGAFPENGSVYITMDGYKRLEELKNVAQDSTQAFVAMWFNEFMSEAWDKGIKPAIKDSGYEPFRVDETEYIDRIDDRIIAQIRRSRFIVADFTHDKEKGVRGSVYYEAGFGHGLGIPVIFTCRKDLINEAHFDTRQYNHIVWDTVEDLREKLANRISAVIGDGPIKRNL